MNGLAYEKSPFFWVSLWKITIFNGKTIEKRWKTGLPLENHRKMVVAHGTLWDIAPGKRIK